LCVHEETFKQSLATSFLIHVIGAGRSFVLFLRNWPADQEGRVTWENDLTDGDVDGHQN
jgi:hypothetical protein